MKAGKTFLLFLCLVGLATYYVISTRPPKAVETMADARVLPLSEGDTVTFMKIENRSSGETFSLEKKPFFTGIFYGDRICGFSKKNIPFQHGSSLYVCRPARSFL